MNTKLTAALPLLFAACYGAAPGRPPRVPLPELADAPDAHVSVHTETKTTIENVTKHASTCPTGHGEGDPACVVTTYQVAEPVTRTTSTAALDNQPISYAQFAVITDPKYNQKLAAIDDLSHKCKRANVPRYAGIGLMLGGLLAGMIVGGDAGKGVAYGGLIGGTASYALGFFAFGGRDCVEAQQLHDSLDFTRELAWDTVEGTDYAERMHSLAEQFNAAHGGRAQATPQPTEEAATQTAMIEIAPTTPTPVKPTKKKRPTKTAAQMHMR